MSAVRVEFPDAPITSGEWQLRRAREKAPADRQRTPFCDDIGCVQDFMWTREACDLCEAQMDYGEVRIVGIELTGERDNCWWILCATCAMPSTPNHPQLVYRLQPASGGSGQVSLVHDGLAA